MEEKHWTQKDYPPSERPYEKALAQGIETLTDGELLAVVLRSGTRKETALELARRILMMDENHPGLLKLVDAGIDELCTIDGIGTVKAIQLKAVAELAVRLSKTRRPDPVLFRKPEEIAGFYMERFRHLRHEEILLGMMDHKERFLGDMVVSRGTENTSLLSIRDLFLQALKKGAYRIFLVHNHPSGDPFPSSEDITLTKRVIDAGNILGIALVDHIIVGDLVYVNLMENGKLKTEFTSMNL